MLYIDDLTTYTPDCPAVVTIGKFDGFHRGHRQLLRAARELAADGMKVTLFTFRESPQLVMAGKRGAGLNSHGEKLALARQLGVDIFVECPFTDTLRHMTADDFLERILLGRLGARAVAAGPDCCFGYRCQGNVEYLRRRAAEGTVGLRVVEKERYLGEPISSTRIRAALARGDMEEAEAMLGYPFGYSSPVVHGLRLGRTLGFPTINQDLPADKLVPALGVYAAEIFLGGERRTGIANVGVKPTVAGSREPALETTIFDFDGDVYGREVRVDLRHFIRPERKFPSLGALREQVDRDRETARDYWESV